ncbi:MAG: gliding motility-associated C-terminal domain-containing protein [Flavobacteriales bacterium]|nr:gliding motility-associated C-terminal domain-containing protein [Bacteroidota bacterium]MCB9241240.1 gliding motility-associated C-terminal domain-containing protein [Flavobacteriales bacterium]
MFIQFEVVGQCTSITVVPDTNLSCAPGIFQLQALNIPSKSLIQWDVGNGWVAGVDSFKLIVPDPDTIDVKLKVVLPSGSVCTKVFKGLVSVIPKPNPNMSISLKKVCSVSDSVTLTDLTSNSVFRTWLVDGNLIPAYGKSVKARFTSDGKKNIVMMAEDQYGCRSVKTFADITEVIAAPSIGIKTFNTEACIEEPVSVALNSTLKPTQITGIKWTMPGASPDTSTNYSPGNFEYSKKGKYSVKLDVTTTEKCSYTVLSKDVIQVFEPLKLQVTVSDSLICTPETITINVKDPGVPGKLSWAVEGYTIYDSSDLFNREFYYTQPGLYDLAITFQDQHCISRFEKSGFLRAERLTADFGGKSYYDCELPFTAQFTNRSVSTASGNIAYEWIIRDTTGTIIDTASTLNHSFYVDDWGYYDVQLIATHENGCVDVSNHEKLIRADSIRIHYVPSPKYVCLNQEVILMNQSEPSSYRGSDRFKWWLYRSGETTPIDSSYLNQPTFRADYSGSYRVVVRAENDLGCVQIKEEDTAFSVVEPIANFSLPDDTVCTDAGFDIISQNIPRAGDYRHHWVFRSATDTFEYDGNSPTLLVPKAGIYDIQYDISILGYCKDTVTKTSRITVSSLEVSLPLDNRACSGLDLNPELHINNKNPGTDTSIKYLWAMEYGSDYSMSNHTSSSPTITFNKDGDRVIRAYVWNSVGCKDTAYSDTIRVGLNPGVICLDSSVCAGSPIPITTAADTFINRWFTEISPSATYTYDSIAPDSASLTVTSNGSYTFKVIASRDSMCFDTTVIPIEIVRPTASFYLLDSNFYCAPSYVRFRSNSENADTLFWDFGDGKKLKTTDYRVTTLYTENTGSLKPYTVQLVAKNSTGCADTLTRTGLIKIDGPAIDFKLSNHAGCEPLDVQFTGKTDNVHKMYIDYGDGVDFGYQLGGSHTYYNKYRIIEQSFQPIILVSDKNGCTNVVKSDSVVRVKPGPTAVIGLLDSIACTPITVNYLYLGRDYTGWYWDFDGNGTQDGDRAAGKHTYSVPGRYNMTLVNWNEWNCADTAVRVVNAVKAPEIRFDLNHVLCVGEEIRLVDSSLLDLPLKNRTWHIVAPGVDFESNDSTVSFNATPGSTATSVQLTVTDSMGCSSSRTEQRLVRDSMNSESAVMNVVSVVDSNRVSVQFKPPTTSYLETGLDREVLSSWQRIKILSPFGGSVYDTISTNVERCYSIQHLDSCGFQSKRSETHCTIHLSAGMGSPGEVDLTWSPYVGWLSILKQEVYRRSNVDWEKVGEVGGFDDHYTDTDLCGGTYCYKIVAIHGDGVWMSASNVACADVLEGLNQSTTSIDVATVENDQLVRITLQSNNNASQFKLTKEWDGNSQTISVDDVQYDDVNVDVHTTSYRYYAYGIDVCGLDGKVGDEGTTILLTIDQTDQDKFTLNWTPYSLWSAGLASYEIVRINGNQREVVDRVSASTQRYDGSLSSNAAAAYCFVIQAIRSDGVISTSNSVCLTGRPYIHVPNAFRPSSEVGNNVFKPSLLFIQSPLETENGLYEFEIYNRWGGRVFSTNNPQHGWDGMVDGTQSPSGAYFYTLRVRGSDNFARTITGTVNLIR